MGKGIYKGVTKEEFTNDKELNDWALNCLHSLAKAPRKRLKKLALRYREETVRKVIETGTRLSKEKKTKRK